MDTLQGSGSMMRTARRVLLCAGLLGALASCGGGSSEPAPSHSGLCASGVSHGVVARAQASVGKNAAAAVLGCSGAIGQPRWTQTTGPAVTLLADKTQTLSFDAPSAGSYRFQLAFVDPAGSARTEEVALEVAAHVAPSLLTLRASHSVRMGGNASVRAWPAAGTSVQAIRWTQLEGPPVTLNTADPYVAIFTAPAVGSDTVIRLRATLTTTGGATDSDEVMVLVERHTQAAADDAAAVWAGQHVSRVYPFRAASPYAGDLVPCAYDAALRSDTLCPLSRLPFLAQQNGGAPPTVEQVMDRVLVSHDWLGRNFETFLRTQEPQGDFRRMLMSTTAVVLGTQVRPSFYYAATGAIYLDADNFWLTPAERDTVSEVPDFRGDFDRDLAYGGVWRYVQNNQSIFVFFDPRARVTRDASLLLYDAGWLMYHELGHALDFMPPSAYGALDPGLSAWGHIAPRYGAGRLTSNALAAQFPLSSAVLRGLAQVKFWGVAADATQRGYTPDQVADFFNTDIATDEYNYSTIYEDAAMTLEELLMSRRLGIRRDVAITDKITDTTTGSTLIVRWGQRGRVGSDNIKPRARALAQALVPWFDLNEVDNLPAPLPMRTGESWNANLSLPAPPSVPHSEMALAVREQQHRFRRELQRMAHHRHQGTPPFLRR
ncbi:MAG: hypothetical protein KIT60_28085 [Burkholderiaceae bacterium]|nr:hypothetical protein [Burkholderiaceae bacterium]